MWSRSNSCRPAIDPADPMGEARIKRIAVIGGGIAGLAAAHRLTEIAHERNSALEILLFEARERVGGAIATEHVDGFVVEAGPDSLISAKPWALALCERLGLEERLISTNPRSEEHTSELQSRADSSD